MTSGHLSNHCGGKGCHEYVAEGIQCDACNLWYHQRCSKLTKKSYQLCILHKALKLVCASCVTLTEKYSKMLEVSSGKAINIEKRTTQSQYQSRYRLQLQQQVAENAVRGKAEI